MASDPADRRGACEAPALRLSRYRRARSLTDLVALTGADSEHEAYFAAKREWAGLQERLGTPPGWPGNIPGSTTVVDGTAYHVHGITHADTAAEGSFLRDRVGTILDRGGTVFCEQGLRGMYFTDLEGVCEMDDYRWAMARSDGDLSSSPASGFSGVPGDVDGIRAGIEGLRAEADRLRENVREATFSLVESGGEVYGERFERALGDVASALFVGHEQHATGEDFEAFRRSRAAAEEPSQLPALQTYYRRSFLPQPLEREWLRRHDPGLELVTHARNERLADYATYHEPEHGAVHLVVGAAHQPGVTYYLRRHRDGDRSLEDFELLP